LKKILYMALVDWFWIKQRPHHFCEILSENNSVTYFSRRSWKNSTNVVQTHSLKENCINESSFKLNNNLDVVRTRVIPKENEINIIKSINNNFIKNKVKNLEEKQNFDIIVLTHPSHYDYIPKKMLESKIIVYDCMDNYKEFNNGKRDTLISNEKKILEISNIVIVSSINLKAELASYNYEIEKKIFIINNAVDIKSFSLENLTKENYVKLIQGTNKYKVGYIGTISNWVDFELIKYIAEKNKDIDFYMIGPIEKGVDCKGLKDVHNIIFTGSQPYYSIPNILSQLDVAVMPFIMNKLIQSVNPVKIYEYMALGKPTIALRYNEMIALGEIIYTYKTKEEFNDKLRIALNEGGDKELIKNRIDFANLNTWQLRVKQFESIISKYIDENE